ncbi:MAG: TIM barrel protein [Thermodesulfobacteriota bacterium]
MSIKIAVRVSYPENGRYDWHDALTPYVEVGAVEVAFHLPEKFLEKVDLAAVVAPFSTLPLKVTTVHMAHARITEFQTFEAVLKKTIAVARDLGCRNIVVHPSNARLKQVEGWIEAKINPLLADAGIMLCWETFAGQRRFLSGIEQIADFCQGKEYHRACYDTSHLHRPQAELLADVENYAQVIGCFHVSNRSERLRQQHLPLRHPEGDIAFEELLMAIVRRGFQGPIVLEYLPACHEHLLPDALWARRLLAV